MVYSALAQYYFKHIFGITYTFPFGDPDSFKTTEKLKVKSKKTIYSREKKIMVVLTKFALVIVWIMTFFFHFLLKLMLMR